MTVERPGIAGGGRGRTAIALLLALSLAVLTIQAVVHSVHHAIDSDAAACPIFLATQHSTATVAERPIILVPLPAEGPRMVLPPPRIGLVSPIEPHHGRSPPALPIA